MTFAEILAELNREIDRPLKRKFPAPFERSLRRALHKMVTDGTILAIGKGGRADPFRYFFEPMALALMSKDKTQYGECLNALLADAGAARALDERRK